MILKIKNNPIIDDYRYVTKFALLPTKVGRSLVWLEKYYEIQQRSEYAHFDDGEHWKVLHRRIIRRDMNV